MIRFKADQVIGNIEAGFTFGFGCDLFEKAGNGDLKAGFTKFMSFCLPIIEGFDIGPKSYVTTFEDIEDLGGGPFAAVLSAGGKPDELREVNRGDDGGLFGFDD